MGTKAGIFPFSIGRRTFLGVEFFHGGWGCFLLGLDLGHRPTVHLGWWIIAIEED